ncbi:MAG TPA: hypothetical protein VJ036_05985 [bacterium]|jgi:hypothetical protein|nr:hypothetical protein [bacterium]
MASGCKFGRIIVLVIWELKLLTLFLLLAVEKSILVNGYLQRPLFGEKEGRTAKVWN